MTSHLPQRGLNPLPPPTHTTNPFANIELVLLALAGPIVKFAIVIQLLMHVFRQRKQILQLIIFKFNYIFNLIPTFNIIIIIRCN